MEERVYIVRREKTQFSHKMNWMNRFTYHLNRFKPYKKKENYDEEWNVSTVIWVDSNNPEVIWYDSKQVWIDSDHVRELDESFQTTMIRYKFESIHYTSDLIHTKSESTFLFQRLNESIQTSFDTIQQSQRVESACLGHKECKFWRETCKTQWSRVLDLLGCFVQSNG